MSGAVQKADSYESKPTPTNELPKRSKQVDLLEALAARSATRLWLAEGAIEGTPLILLSGPEKRGKSWITIDLAVSVASATKWLGQFQVTASGSVVVVDGEYGAGEWARRARRICAARGLDPQNVFPKIRYFDAGFGLFLTKTNEALLEVFGSVRDDPPRCIIVDPLRNFLEGDENSARDVLEMMEVLNALRTIGAAPLLAVHHLNKSGSMSGSRALKTRADLLIDGSDEASPWYTTMGRTLRSGDAITTPFNVQIKHDDDHNDAIAKTHLSLRFEGSSTSKTNLSKSAHRLLDELKGRTAPASSIALGKSCGVLNGSARSRALNELRDAGLVAQRNGKWELSSSEFFDSMATSEIEK